MPAYESDLFNPPAPVARVTLRDPVNVNTISDVLMLIDSGADVSLVPQTSVNELESDFASQEMYELKDLMATVALRNQCNSTWCFSVEPLAGGS